MKKSISKIAFLSLVSSISYAESFENNAILVSDMTRDAIYITKDFNGNGTALDTGETAVYFDGNNLSGLTTASKSVFSIFQSSTGYIYLGDGGSDSVYRLADRNADGDAQDAGEANVWFSEANVGGYSLPTPNSVYQAKDNALYIVNAGTRSRPSDVVYRTVDLNHDGDANDAGEAAVWLDLSTLASSTVGGGIPINKSSAFDITFSGNAAYIADLMGGETDTIFKAQDSNLNGFIDANELSVFIDDNNAFGVPVATGLISDENGALYTLESSSSKEQSIFRLSDHNDSGTIDEVSEAQEIWNESKLASLGVEMGSAFGMALGPDGEILITSAGRDIKDNLFRLVDLNADGDFLDEGETILWAIGNGSDQFVDFARSAEYIQVMQPVPLPPSLILFGSSFALFMFGRKKQPLTISNFNQRGNV